MSSLFSHIFISVTILLIFSNRLGIDPKKIIILCPVSILPDIDIFFFHRAWLHNIFVPLIPFLLFVFMKNRRDVYGIMCFYLMSHVILDIFDGGVYLLYPFYYKLFYMQVELMFRHDVIIPIIDYGISNKIMNNGVAEPMISSENIGIAILLTISVLINKIYGINKKCRS